MKIIDCVYILNLDSEKFKYDLLIEKINKLNCFRNLNIKRFSAVEGKTTNNIKLFKEKHNNYIQQLSPIKKKYYLKKLNNEFSSVGLFRSYGSFGCLLSYIKIFNDATTNNFKNILLLQDDIYFHKNFDELFNKINFNSNSIYIGYSQYGEINRTTNVNNRTFGLFGLFIKNITFKLILKELNKFSNPADACVSFVLTKYFSNTSRKLEIPLIIPDITRSNTLNKKIIETRIMDNLCEEMGWKLELYDMSKKYYS